MTAEILVAGVAIAFLAAACYAVTGFGFALVMTPLLAITWDVKSAVATSVVLSTVALLPLLVGARAHVPISRVTVLVIGSFAGIPLGVVILEALDADALQALVASTVIIAALLLYFRPTVAGGADSGSRQLGTGFVSGVVGGSTSMGGPPIVLYLIGREPDVAAFRATLLAFFLPGSVLQIALLAGVGGSRAMSCCLSGWRCQPLLPASSQAPGCGDAYALSASTRWWWRSSSSPARGFSPRPCSESRECRMPAVSRTIVKRCSRSA